MDSEILALQEAARGRFSIERELGRGGMGVVVLARDLALDRAVALKVLPVTLARQPALRERFLREARTAAGLSHPNVVPIHAVEEHDDVVFFVMGYVDGETLARRVSRVGPLSPADATRLVQEVAWALAYAHGRGIVHRDIKPDNILIERATGRALVTDFGIARVADATRALTIDGHVMGTAQFMSPEQAAGEKVDGRSDLYSLGVVAFLALTGALPFEAESVTALLAMQVTRPAPPVASRRPGIPARLATAIDRCLAKQPDDRFPSAEALADALTEVETRTVDVPPQVRNFQRVAEQSTMMLFIVTVFSLVSLPGSGSRWPAIIGGPVGAIAAVLLDLGRRARQLLIDGYGAGDVIRAFVVERDAREAEVAVMYSGKRQARIARMRRRAFIVAGTCMPLAIALLFTRRLLHWPKPLSIGLAMPFYIAAIVALIIGLNSSPKAERRSWAFAGRLWRSGFTLFFFRLAGLGVRAEDRAAPSLDPTRADVVLPDAVRRDLPELPKLLERYDATLAALRRREEDVERALAEVGPGAAGDGGDGAWRADTPSSAEGAGVTTRAVLLSRRLSLVSDLRSALELVRAQRTDVVAAHENVRIQLARVRAGIARSADLQPDAATLQSMLDAAQPGG
ncbi:protein kinase [Gemmatirosa kalamazoonensis]|uniref:non-specific serine/threonine protein kinase n=1 Tax=Gemmatirosa kalamazoonensis TaxID=861299 RepID=W0RJH3_9BACT|nr:serine/threonine-protein kinase [Gemmatirosa kalamazoonensis]AHG90582.1 protein kinase [Gemmatirosa kalamazoonensis]